MLVIFWAWYYLFIQSVLLIFSVSLYIYIKEYISSYLKRNYALDLYKPLIWSTFYERVHLVVLAIFFGISIYAALAQMLDSIYLSGEAPAYLQSSFYIILLKLFLWIFYRNVFIFRKTLLIYIAFILQLAFSGILYFTSPSMWILIICWVLVVNDLLYFLKNINYIQQKKKP